MEALPTFEHFAEFVRESGHLRPNVQISPDTRFERDLGITGDDGVELLQAAEERFGVTFTSETFGLKTNEFLFGPESSLLDFITPFKHRKSTFRAFTVGELHNAVLKELKSKS